MKKWIVMGFGVALCFPASAVERYVDLNNPTPAAPYTNWASAATDIQTAVNAASTGDVIWVTNGVYGITSEILIENPLTLRSVNGPEVTTIDAQWFSRCLNLGNYAVVVAGFTIQNGFAVESSPEGGGVYCAERIPVLTDCVISGCTAMGNGGGVFYGTLSNCVVRDNVTFDGSGGGIYGGTAYKCIISGNESQNGSGGGLAQANADGCLIYNNTATWGGGISDGQAIGCTICDNSAEDRGGGMWAGEARNTIIYHNSCLYSYNYQYSDTWNTVAKYSCLSSTEQGRYGNITNTPLFFDRSNGNYRLAANSPCIDTGINAYANTITDLDGAPRVFNSRVDMGSYEFNSTLPDSDNDGLNNAQEIRLGTNPNNPDTDGDGFKDGWEVEHGWSPTQNDSSVLAYIESNPSVFGYYTEGTVGDLAMGEMMVKVLGTNISVRLQMMKSSDLITWTNTEQSVDWTIPATGKEFFRVRAQP